MTLRKVSKTLAIAVAALLSIPVLILFLVATLNWGDSSLSEGARDWLSRKRPETPSTRRAFELAYRIQPGRKPLSNPRACSQTGYFCHETEHEKARSEIASVQKELGLFREMLQEEGLSISDPPSMIGRGFQVSSLLAVSRYDMMDLSLKVASEPTRVLEELEKRAQFWKRVLREPSSLFHKMIALACFRSFSSFVRDWYLWDLENARKSDRLKKAFLAGPEAARLFTDLEAPTTPAEVRSLLEPTLAYELQVMNTAMEATKTQATNLATWFSFTDIYDEPARDLRGLARYGIDGVLGRLMKLGFQPNTTLNATQSYFKEALTDECLTRPEEEPCASLARRHELQLGIWPGLRNPIGRQVMRIFVSSGNSMSRAFLERSVEHNRTLDRISSHAKTGDPAALEGF